MNEAAPEFRARKPNNFDKQGKRPFEQDFMDTRRAKREIIGREGTAVVWGKSPPPGELYVFLMSSR